MNISSSAFGHMQRIPRRHTCEGNNSSPSLSFSGQPGRAESLVLIVDDPDAPSGTYTHWLVYNIPANSGGMGENGLPPGSLQGANSAGHTRYDGPCPPIGSHRYVFKLFALDSILDLSAGASRQALESAMHGHVLGHAELVGLYEKTNGKA